MIKSDFTNLDQKLRFALFGINHLNDGILITDKNNKIVFLNRSLQKLTGYSEKELLGKNPKILKSGLHDSKFYEQMWQSLEENGHWEGEVLNRRKDGTLFYERLKIIVIKKNDGTVENYIAILSDITEEKRLEKDIIAASKIQRQMFPQDIKTAFFQIKTYYKPKRYISGDFFDYVWMKERWKLYGVVGDFKGHGISAGLLMSAMKVIFHNVIRERKPLAKVVKKINASSFKYFALDTFAAAIFFEIDYRTMTLTIVSAGINCFLSITKKGRKMVKIPGMFLGMFEDAKFEEQTYSISKGDILYFLSDGVIDNLPRKMDWSNCDFQTVYEKLKSIVEKGVNDDATIFGIEILIGDDVGREIKKRYKIHTIDDFYALKEEITNILKELHADNVDIIWMALTEGINNAWLHGNKRDEKKTIHLSMKSIRHKRVIFRIRDEGSGYSGNEQVKKLQGHIEEEFEKRLFEESGRGLLIMMKVFDRVIYNQKGNEIFLVKNISE